MALRDEVARRGVHAGGTAIPLSYVLFPDVITWTVVQAFLVAGLVVGVVLEALRLYAGLNWAIYERLTREYEQDNPAGYFLYAVGMTVTGLAFPPGVAVPAMLMLTVADPISGLLGGDELRDVKRTRVLLVTFGVATLLAVPFVPPVAAILGGAAATVADGVKPVVGGYVIDDNLSIPILAAAVMQAAVAFLPAAI